MAELDALGSVLEEGLSRYETAARNEAVSNYENAVNQMLSRMHESNFTANGNTGTFEYKPEEYVRLTTTSKYDVASLVSRLQAEGVEDFVSTHAKVDGQFILEVNVSDIDKVRQFEADNDTSFDYYSAYNRNSTEEIEREEGTNRFGSYYFNQFSEIASVFNAVMTPYGAISHYEMQSMTVRTDDNGNITSVFHRDKEVTISGDDIYVDGQQLTDLEEIRQYRENFDLAVREHNKDIERIQTYYQDKLNGANPQDLLAQYRQNKGVGMEPAQAAYCKEMEKLNGKQYKAEGTKFTERVSAWKTRGIRGITDKINQDIQVRLKGGNEASDLSVLEKDFGFHVPSDANFRFKETDILNINKVLMERANKEGILLINSFQRIDRKALMKLTGEQLKKLGITSAGRDLFLKINQGFGFRLMDTALFQVGSFALSKSLDSDTKELVSNVKKTKKYGTSAYKVTKKQTETFQMKRAARKAERDAAKAKDGASQNTSSNKPKNKKKQKSTNLTDAQKQRQKAFADNQTQKFKKTKKRENSKGPVSKLRNAKNKIAAKINNTAVGKAMQAFNKVKAKVVAKLIPVISTIVATVLLISLILGVFIVMVFLIMSLMGAVIQKVDNMVAPDDYKGTVAYSIYAALEEQEHDWVDYLNDFESVYDERMNLSYTSRYESFNTYINKSPIMGIGDVNKGTIYLKPFGNDFGVKRYVSSFSGERSVDILTNSNRYSRERDNNYAGYAITSESGHTSNIRDIIAMVDVMYDHETDSFSDTFLASEEMLGKSPAQMDWEAFCNRVTNVIKWIFKAISGLLGNKDWYDEYLKNRSVVTDYKTVLNYAITLFQASHQEQVTLQPEFYKVASDEVMADYENATDKDSITFTIAAVLGQCVQPDILHCTIDMDPNDNFVISYINPETGIKRRVDQVGKEIYKFDAEPISMANLEDSSTMCVWRNMGADKTTFDGIVNSIENKKKLFPDSTPCWYGGGISTHSEGPSYYIIAYAYEDGEEEFPEPAIDFTNEVWNDEKHGIPHMGEFLADQLDQALEKKIEAGDYTDKYVWDRYIGIFTNNHYEVPEKLNKNYDSMLYTQPITATYTGLTYPDGRRYGVYQDLVDTLGGKDPKDLIANSVQDNTTCVYYQVTLSDGTKRTVTVTRVSMSNPVISTTQTYTHQCAGDHAFEYCAGHIACHRTGIVYSASQEQIELGGMVSGDAQMVALDYDMENIYGKELLGKINQNTLDGTTCATALVTGQGDSPVTSIQGCPTSFSSGLNLISSTTAQGIAYWDTRELGMETDKSATTSYFFFSKDIFDIDTAIRKGDNVFGYKYTGVDDAIGFQGWTADNMQLAIAKMSMDWAELYGFDAPWSITREVPLSATDINLIIEDLKGNYGHLWTDDREAVVRKALGVVGWGSYNTMEVDSHNHSFLAAPHKCIVSNTSGIDFTTSCVCGDPLAFVEYVYYAAGITKSPKSADFTHALQPFNKNSDAIPGDILVHLEGVGDEGEAFLKSDYYTMSGGTRAFQENWKQKYVIFIGVTNNDINFERTMWHKKNNEPLPDTTEVVCTIPAGTALYVTLDVTKDDSRINYGGVMLMGFNDDVVYFDNGVELTRTFDNTYSWMNNIDGRVRRYNLLNAQ